MQFIETKFEQMFDFNLSNFTELQYTVKSLQISFESIKMIRQSQRLFFGKIALFMSDTVQMCDSDPEKPRFSSRIDPDSDTA
jgi:hypothetical protein